MSNNRNVSKRESVGAVPLAERAAWSVTEFCALYGLSPATLYRRAQDDEIALSKFRGRTLVTREAADAWKARMSAPSVPGNAAAAG